MARDYVAEMRDLINKATAAEPDGYIPGVVAAGIVFELRENDPELLHGWLDMQAEQFVREAIGARDRSIRSRMRSTSGRREFGEAKDRFDDGDSAALDGYLHLPITVAANVHKPLGILTHEELIVARNEYQKRANTNLFYVRVLDAVAERVTIGVVEDHWTEAQLENLFSMFQ